MIKKNTELKEDRQIPSFVTLLTPLVIAVTISTSLPITKIIGKITIEIKNEVFIKKPCIPNEIPSILAPDSSLICVLISLNIAGGKIKDLEVILKEMDLKIETAKKEVKMLENNKENLTDLLELYTRQLEYGKKDFKQRASDK